MATSKGAEPTTPEPVDPVTEPKAEPEPVQEPPAEPVKDAAWWEGKARAMEADAKKAAKRLAQLEAAEQARADAEKTEIQKAIERAERAEAEAKAAKLGNLKRDIAHEIGLPAALVKFLGGDTAEEIKANAAEMLAAMPKATPPKGNPTNPSEPQTGETREERRKRLQL